MKDSNLVDRFKLLEQLQAHAHDLIFCEHRGLLNSLSIIYADRKLLHHDELRATVNKKTICFLIGEQTPIQDSWKVIHVDFFVDLVQVFYFPIGLCRLYNFHHQWS